MFKKPDFLGSNKNVAQNNMTNKRRRQELTDE
jgi:hypothetical protein